MAASPAQAQPIIVELRPLPAPFPPNVNDLLAQRGVALLSQFGVAVGGLSLIDSAAGFATAAGIRAMSLDPQVAYIYADATLRPSSGSSSQVPLATAYPLAVNADRVWSWQQGITGVGATVAVLDSGVNTDPDLTLPTNRILAAVNFGGDLGGMADAGGHGTHVAGIVGGDGFASNGQYIGIAPGANVLNVRVLSHNGNGRISSVVRGIEWSLAHRTQYNIRLINLSLGMPSPVPYRLNPLDAAVEMAWLRGVAVVAAAGNTGPTGSVDSPGDDPYVITVGATDDRGTAALNDDVLAPFSAFGTPPGSTQKPDVVAPGRRIVSLRVPGSYLDTHLPDRVTVASNGATYFRLTGTSMATPVVTGAAALMVQQMPTLKPDNIKAILMGTAQSFGWAAGGPAVPAPNAAGAGVINAWGSTYYGWPATPAGSPGRAKNAYRPSNAAARALYPALYGTPLIWKDPNYLGIPWSTLNWTNLTWDDLAWDNLAWDDLAWDNLAWDNLAWDDLAWDNLAWDDLAWDSNPGWNAAALD